VAIILNSFDIESPEHQKVFKIDLVEGLDPLHVEFIKTKWSPLLTKRRNLALLGYHSLPEDKRNAEAWNQKLDLFGAPDAHWEWDKKCAVAPQSDRKVYGLLNHGEVEAAMVLKFGEKSRLNRSGVPLVYVDFVSTAPWNRPQIQAPQRFKKLGKLMIGAALIVSYTKGLEGRCGLHSLVQAEGFYSRIGMTNLGMDDAKELKYFEFDVHAAKNFFNGDTK